MGLKKRTKADVSTPDKDLPLNNLSLYEQNNHQLYKTLEQYRKENESLNRNNALLSRKNDLLECLVSSVSSLWDCLNSDVDVLISQQVPENKFLDPEENEKKVDSNGRTPSEFWEKMINTKFPFISPSDSDGDVDLNELKCIFESEEFLILPEHHDESEWNEAKESFLDAKIHLFESKKNALLRSLKNNSNKFKTADMGSLNILKYNCLNYCKLFFIMYNRIEISRLNKQNAFLKFELRTFAGHDGKKEPELPSSSDSDAETVKMVENVEEVTEEMVLGSSLYSRLFNYAKNMDKEICRLESDNSELRNKISSLTEGPSNQMMKLKADFDTFIGDMSEKVSSFESEYSKDSKELAALKESFNFVSEELEQYKNEREKMVVELKSLESKMTKLLRQNASICKSMCTPSDNFCATEVGTENATEVGTENTTESATNTATEKATHNSTSSDKIPEPNPSSSYGSELDFYKEHLLNISEELEDVSCAFEKKQRMCDDLMRQVNESSETRKNLERLQDSHASLVDRFNRLVDVTNTKVSVSSKNSEILESMVQDYKRSWTCAFNRGVYLQHQRDVAVSAVCELQSQYRKSCRSQKALQDYLASVRTGFTRSSSLESTLGEVENVIEQENAILRRRMTCTVCSENFRDHVITKCGHVFCHHCLSNNIKSRNRKCPQCKITFDKNDTQRIFLD
uniref:E3 ubiquitin protein ligase n=1 Tax=Theileria annulata TaxID=5874 RepID=A0A3B0N7F1_THEAN